MITVRMFYFAAMRELMGKGEEDLDLPDGIVRVADFAHYLESARPALKGRLFGVRIAINESFSNGDDELRNGDTIALIPPVAGG